MVILLYGLYIYMYSNMDDLFVDPSLLIFREATPESFSWWYVGHLAFADTWGSRGPGDIMLLWAEMGMSTMYENH